MFTHSANNVWTGPVPGESAADPLPGRSQRAQRAAGRLPMFGLVSVLPDDGSEVTGNPLSQWVDTVTDADRSDFAARTYDVVQWCRDCDYVPGSDAPVSRSTRKRQAACPHDGMTEHRHQSPADDPGRTAMVVPSAALPTLTRPLFGPRIGSDRSAYNVRLAAERDRGRLVRKLNAAQPGPQSFGTGQAVDLPASSAARSIIGSGKWQVRTGEAKRFATPDRGQVRVSVDVASLTDMRGDCLATFTGPRRFVAVVSKSGKRTAKVRARDAIKRQVAAESAAKPMTGRAERRRATELRMAAQRAARDHELTF